MVNNSNKCPECGSNNIHKEKIHHTQGVIIDYTCKDCMHSWSHYMDKKEE